MIDARVVPMNYEGETRYLGQVMQGTVLWAYLAPKGTDPRSITGDVILAKGSRVY